MAEQVRVVITAQDKTKQGVDSVEKNLQNLQDKAAAAFAGLALAIGGATKVAMDFEASMDRVAAVSGATSAQFKQLEQTALKMGAETVYSATQASDALSYLAMAGFEVQQQVDAIPGVLSMAAAGMVDLASAADIGSGILAGFNLEAGEMNRVADILTKGFTATNTELVDLGEAMKFMAPVASALGLSIEETTAAVGLLGNAGIKGGNAGRQLRSALNDLLKPSDEAAGLMERLGISAVDNTGQFKSFADIIQNVVSATEGMTEAQRAQTVATLMGSEGATAFLAIMQAGPDTLRQLTTELENSGGTAERIATQQLDNLKGTLEVLKSQFEDTAIAAGDSFSPQIGAAADIMTDLLAGLSEFIRTSPAVVQQFGVLSVMVAGSTVAVTGLIKAFTGLWASMGPIGWAVMGVSALVGALGTWAINARAAQIEQEKQEASLISLSSEWERYESILNDAEATASEKAAAQGELKRITEELGDLMPELVTKWDAEGRAIEINTQKLRDNTAAAKENKQAKDEGNLQSAYNAMAVAEGQVKAIEREIQERKKGKTEGYKVDVAAGVLTQEQADQLMVEDLALVDSQYAQQLRDAQRRYAEAKALVAKQAAQVYGASESSPGTKDDGGEFQSRLGQGSLTGLVIDTGDTGTGGTGIGSGRSEMSAPLKAAMESLDDLKAYEQTPDRLKAVLEKTREILRVHGAELAKLGKDRDLIRQRDIQLPDQIAQAEYQAALTQLDADKTLKNLSPEKFAEGLRGIKDKFADYLEAHPDLAIQMDLRLKGATDEELRAPLERWRKEMQQSEQLGIFDGLEYLKVGKLREGLSLAQTAGDADAVIELTAQIRELEAAMQEAAFDAKFKRIKDAREQAFAGAAKELSDLQKQLITEESKGDKTDPDEVARIKQRMLDAVRPALEAERDALQSLLDSTTGNDEASVKRREEINRALTSVMSELYSRDVDAHRIATEAKTAQERTAAERRKDIQKDAIDALSKAEKRALEDFKAGAKAQEDYLQGQIDLRERLLKQYDRQIAVEERLKKIRDAQANVDLLQQTGQREMVFNADGSRGYRIVGMDEAQKALDEAKLEHQRQTNREALQDEITNLRERLDSLKESNRTREEELRTHFANAREVLETGFNEMNGVQGAKLDTMATELQTKLDNALGIYRTYVTNVNAELDKIKTASTPATTTTAAAAAQTSQTTAGAASGTSGWFGKAASLASGLLQGMLGNVPVYGNGTYADTPHLAVVGDRKEYITAVDHIPRLAGEIVNQMPTFEVPTMPAHAFAGAQTYAPSFGPFEITVKVDGASAATPGYIASEVRTGTRGAIEDALRSGLSLGNLRGVRR